MPTCTYCGAAIALPIPAAALPKLRSTVLARAALIGVHAHAVDDDRGHACIALSRGPWCETLPIRAAEQLVAALEAVMRPGDI